MTALTRLDGQTPIISISSRSNELRQVIKNLIGRLKFQDFVSVKRLKHMVATLHLGEESSGYCLSPTYLYNGDYERVETSLQNWTGYSGVRPKAPTSVLFRPNNILHSFGFDAEKYYLEHSDDVDFKEWYFFKHLKMKIYIDKDALTKDTIIEDSKGAGRSMKAVDVFAAVIKYFKNHLIEYIRDRNAQEYFDVNVVYWVITVPAFWDLKAKQFMKDAAEKAGISGDHLTLVLEPEAALSYCQNAPVSVETTRDDGKDIPERQMGQQYIVFNSSGATTDITVYEDTSPNMVKEIHQACGGHYGGDTVNEEFIKFLTTLLGRPVIEEMRNKHPYEYFEFMSEFEIKKTGLSVENVEGKSMLALLLHPFWCEIFEDITGKTLTEAVFNSSYKGTVSFKKNKLRISQDIFRQFFDYSINNVLRVFEELFRKPAIENNCTVILAIGSDSDSPILINAIRQRFPNLNVIVPKSPDLAVLQGAVLLGFHSYTITKREHEEKGDLEETLRGLGLENVIGLQEIFHEKYQKCFWNRVYLVGPYSVGKSCLAKILVGEPLSTIRQSTDGIWIYMGKAGMNIDKMEWVFFKKGNAITEVLTNMLMSMSTLVNGSYVDDSVNDVNFDEKTETVENVKDTFKESPETIQISGNIKGVTVDDVDTGEASHKMKDDQLPQERSSNNYMVDNIHDNTSLDNQKHIVASQIEKDKEKLQSATVSSDNSECEWMKEITSNMSPDKIHELVVKAVQEGKYKQKIVPIDIWDFGGQKDYYMTHQLFITSRGIFVLMFNGSVDLYKNIPDLSFLPGHVGKPTVAVYLLHWVNSILTYCKRTNSGFPRIIFVATHKDAKWFQRTQEARRNQLEEELQQLFERHSGLKHLEFKPLIFVNATNQEDPEILDLRERLMQRATEHPRWGEPMPTRWIPLELQLAQKSAEGINIISRDQLLALNSKNESMVLSDMQIETFLKVQHSLGKLLYFDVENLCHFIIISPAYLVEVLRSIVREIQFWPKGEMFSRILSTLQETGMIERNDIYFLWEQDEFNQILPYKEYMIQILVHLDVIIAPRTSFEGVNNPIHNVSRFLVPCMVTKGNDTLYLNKFRNANNSIILAYSFTEQVIPPALFYRFLSSLITSWDIKNYKEQHTHKRMLFSDLAVVTIDNSHDVAVQVETNRVIVSLIHAKTKRDIIPTLASSLQECLTAAVVRISEFYSVLTEDIKSANESTVLPFNIEFGVFCKSKMCFFYHNEMHFSTDEAVWICKNHKQRHATKYLSAWFSSKEPCNVCEISCDGLGRLESEQCPLPQHIMRLAVRLSLVEIREIAISLEFQLEEWHDLEHQFQHQTSNNLKFMALWSCVLRRKNFSFHELRNVLELNGRSAHLLCQVFRDIVIDVSDIADETLDTIPSVDALHDLSNHIGNSTMQLAIELEVDLSYIQQIQHDLKNKLLEQNRKVFIKWRQNKFPKPTVLRLLKALYRVGKFGPTFKVLKNHLDLRSSPVFGGVYVAQSLVFFVGFCVLFFVCWTFLFLPWRCQFNFDL